MANGWEKLWTDLDPQAVGVPELVALWTSFEELAEASPSRRADALQLARELGGALPVEQRAKLALVIGGLLAPIDWPPDVEREREPLVRALEGLIGEVSEEPGTLTSALGLHRDMVCEVSRTTLLLGTELLRIRCSRFELPVVAKLIQAATAGFLFAYKRKLQERGTAGGDPILESAKARYEVAFQKYATSARAVNDAWGAVIFDGLDGRLEAT